MRFKLRFYHPIVLLLSIHFIRKLIIRRNVMSAVNEHRHEVDLLITSSVYRKNTFIQHALNVTLNWLCNVVNYQDVHKRIIVLAFDNVTYVTLKRSFPSLHVLHWDLPVLYDRFSAGDYRYQLIQVFRANLCAYLAAKRRDFWIAQPDTYWRENLFEVIDMIAGGCFFVRGNEKSERFFKETSRILLDQYATDNNIMCSLCQQQYEGNKCSFIPIMSNWRWHTSDKKFVPTFLQFDGGYSSESKFQQMQRLGAAFVNPETIGEDREASCTSISEIPGDAIPLRLVLFHSFDNLTVKDLNLYFKEF
ncbi:unnamed protein product [Anisakis simplex]|uniref:Nucleotid_trans domain-containing protein n=1 Tax=Anisakis simplex TaxID=6269 RepID=A0A0M3IZT7_ANISI|nr:unnamed protein product [Anisakis simplex]